MSYEFTPKHIDEFGDPVPPNILKPFYTEIHEVHQFNGKFLCRVDDRAITIEWKLDLGSKVMSIPNINSSGIRSIWRDHKKEIMQFILDSIYEQKLIHNKALTIDDIRTCEVDPF